MKRSRSDSRVKLEDYDRLLTKTILAHQHPVTGLLPAFLYKDGTPGWAKNDAWVRDNVYSVLSIWGLAIAYRRRAESEDDRHKAFNLEQSVVKLMRGLLFAMMRQAHKVEYFKKTHDRGSALHAKYNLANCSAVVGDGDWGHLQIDATSLYLLMLAEMIGAGLQIIFTLDEVAFVQNLAFYIEEAYRISDYGIWERGDKSNLGQTELNASSIGMAKAALEAINGLDLFGSRGGPSSVIHVMADQVAQCDTKLNSLLPRESSSKEIDAGLLTIIGFPAFAVERPELIEETKSQILTKLMGKYGCKRFLRDGYQTVKEDRHRLHYWPGELKAFENIECEWPLFFCLLLLDGLIQGDYPTVQEYREKLESVVLRGEDGIVTVPELYLVPADRVSWEYRQPHSQVRVPGRKVLHMWSQSLYILCGLLEDGLLAIGEIDPLNRRLSMMPKPDPLVQVVLLSEDKSLCAKLVRKGIRTETIKRAELDPKCPVKILPAHYLTKFYSRLGMNKKMKLSGRPPHLVGVIGTSQLYTIGQGNTIAFTPQFLDHETFYLCLDNRLLVDLIRTDLAYLKSNWKLMGRPTVVLPILWTMLGDENQWEKSPMFRLLLTLVSGYTSGVRVQVGLVPDFISTAYVRKLDFIDPAETSEILEIPQVDLKIQRSSILVHRQDSYLKRMSDFDPVQPLSPSFGRVYTGSVRKSRKTPPAQKRTGRHSEPPPSPDVEKAFLIVASAYSSRRLSLRTQERLRTDRFEAISSGLATPKRGSLNVTNIEEVIQRLKTESNIYEQADILHHLYNTCGKEFTVDLGNQKCMIGNLLEELYQKAGLSNRWSLVRHTAGMLRKRVEELGEVATDLLVRQKNFSVGHPNNEFHITQPLPSSELLQKICDVSGDDHSAVALTQEILVYLAMFIRSEPELFTEMLRLRIGLIQNVMVSELSRAMGCTHEDALDRLLELSPYDLKHLIHLIFSRKEFTVDEMINRDSMFVVDGQLLQMPVRQLSIVAPTKKLMHGNLQKDVKILGSAVAIRTDKEHEDRHGQWQRRRRLDGALNRVPPDFYQRVWHILERCRGISVGSQYLPQNPTIQEMTPGELKFAERLEEVLNSLPDPDYRQLVVEALMVVGLIAHSSNGPAFGGTTLVIEHIIDHARHLFLQDQKAHEGPALDCCCKHVGSCGGAMSICVHFYDSAPSGRYGTMSYMAQAVADQLRGVHKPTDECKIS